MFVTGLTDLDDDVDDDSTHRWTVMYGAQKSLQPFHSGSIQVLNELGMNVHLLVVGVLCVLLYGHFVNAVCECFHVVFAFRNSLSVQGHFLSGLLFLVRSP